MAPLNKSVNSPHGSWSSPLNKILCDIHHQMVNTDPFVDRISFAIYDQENQRLKTYADSVDKGQGIKQYECALSSLPTLQACVEEHKSRCIDHIDRDTSDTPRHNRWLKAQGFRSSYASPTYCDGQFIGFVFINSRHEGHFTPEVCHELSPYLTTIQQAAADEYQAIHQILEQASQKLARSAKHHNSAHPHHQRIYHFTHVIAQHIANDRGLDDEFVANICQFSRFHDIGKLYLSPKSILKAQTLAPFEREKMQQHIALGVELIDSLIATSSESIHPSLETLRDIVAHHQELLDGSGYPNGLRGDAIPLSARIITVANIFDALTSHRPYKQAASVRYALLELEKMVVLGKLDAECVNALRYKQQALEAIIARYPESDPKDNFNPLSLS